MVVDCHLCPESRQVVELDKGILWKTSGKIVRQLLQSSFSLRQIAREGKSQQGPVLNVPTVPELLGRCLPIPSASSALPKRASRMAAAASWSAAVSRCLGLCCGGVRLPENSSLSLSHLPEVCSRISLVAQKYVF